MATLLQSPLFSSVSTLVDADIIHSYVTACRPQGSTGAYAFKWDYLASEMLSKLPRPGVTAEVRRDNAITKMKESEVTCAAINHSGYGLCTPRDFFQAVMLSASRVIADILGPMDYGIFEHSSFSAGASTSRRKTHGDPYYKYNTNKEVHVTKNALPYANALIASTPVWRDHKPKLKIVAGNSITTVPKKTDTDRAIAKEPDMNMCLQRSVGRHIRMRLREFGVNLNSQVRNQKLAREGSINNSLATIDLSSASDSLSYRLVADLLPIDWYTVLDDLRSPIGELPDTNKIVWEKFSSMGNGFTFELESLIFFAICKGVALVSGMRNATLGVYGDDLIVPTAIARNVISVLSDIGFSTNTDKTFIEGPFRESCGKHYYQGTDVTPFYVRKPIDTLPRVFWLLNKLRLWAYDSENRCCDPSVYKLWLKLRRTFVHPDYLGGMNIEETSYVYSPEAPRYKLVPKTVKRQIGGYRALLRVFQYSNRVQDPEFIKWARVDEDHCLSVSESLTTLVQVDDRSLVRKKQAELWVPKEYLFPTEIA